MAARPVVLVTGSSGLIGAPVVRRLARRYAVVGLDREGDPHPPIDAECVCVDLTDDDSVRTALARVRHAYGERIAAVVHLAAFYDFSGEPSPKYEQVTVHGTERLLRELQAFRVEELVFSSTVLVHRPTEPGRPIREDDPLEPRWAYPESKTTTEELLAEQHGSVPYVVLRIAGVYSERGDSIPLTQQMKRIYERDLTSRVFPGDLSHGASFVHLDDAVDAIARAVDRRGDLPSRTVILVGEPEAPSYDALQRAFARHLQVDEDFRTRRIAKGVAKAGAWVEDALPFGHPFIKPFMIELADDHFEIDPSRARELLGWVPRHRLLDVVPAMCTALLEDPAGFYRRNRLGRPPRRRAPDSSRTTRTTTRTRKAATPSRPRPRRAGG